MKERITRKQQAINFQGTIGWGYMEFHLTEIRVTPYTIKNEQVCKEARIIIDDLQNEKKNLSGKPTKTQAIQLKHNNIKAALINIYHIYDYARLLTGKNFCTTEEGMGNQKETPAV